MQPADSKEFAGCYFVDVSIYRNKKNLILELFDNIGNILEEHHIVDRNICHPFYSVDPLFVREHKTSFDIIFVVRYEFIQSAVDRIILS